MKNSIVPTLVSMLMLGISANGQQILKRISLTNPNHSSSPIFQGQVNGKLLFTANDGIHGYEYWVSDGTEANTRLLKDINPGPENVSSFMAGGALGWQAVYRFTWKDRFYFLSSIGKRNVALWQTDGTEEGTKKIMDLGVGQTDISFGVVKPSKQDPSPNIYHNKIIFSFSDSLEKAIWKTDGTLEGTKKIIDLKLLSGYTGMSIPKQIIIYNDRLIFWVEISAQRSILFSSDGTQAGTKAIFEMDVAGQPNLTEYKGRLYFTGNDTEHGFELWSTNAKPGGTKMVVDLWPGPKSGSGREMNVVNNRLIYIANDSVYGIEPFVTDGTAEGTHLLKNIYPGKQRFFLDLPGWDMSAFEDRAFFVANDSIHGPEMWVTDGTEKGTFMLKDLAAGTRSGLLLGPFKVMKFKDHFYFSGTDYSNGYINIWKTGCVQNDVTNVLPINPAFGGEWPLYGFKDKLFFSGGAASGYIDPAFVTDSTQLQFANTTNLDLKLFPNPSTNYTLAAISNFTPSLAQLTIYNRIGQLIRTETVDLYCDCRTKTINLGNLSKGIYLITVFSKNEKVSKKLVVQ
jgi:ELWxxDGT repeat protein